MNNKSNVSTGKPKVSGAIYRAPKDTPVPTDATGSLPQEFTCLGYITENGIKNSAKKETNEIKAWGGDVVLISRKGFSDKLEFELMESKNPEVLKTVHGDDNVTGDAAGGLSVAVNGADDLGHAYVVDMLIRGGKKRICIPDGYVTEVGDVTYKDDDAIIYPVTLGLLPDEDGNNHYEYIKEG